MGTLTIRQLDERTHARLRGRAASHGRSVEAEVRAILTLRSTCPTRTFCLPCTQPCPRPAASTSKCQTAAISPARWTWRDHRRHQHRLGVHAGLPRPGGDELGTITRPRELSICVVTVEEIERGLGRLPAGRRRRDLEQRWARLVDAFADTIAVYDVPAARATASILVTAESSGRPMALGDAQIAGICLSQVGQLATRNERDFTTVTDLTVINPFT